MIPEVPVVPPAATHTPLPYATEKIFDVPNWLVCVFHVTALFVLVRSAPPEPPATQTPFPYATEKITVPAPKFEVCVFHVTPLSVLVRSGPDALPATAVHTPFPYANELMVVVKPDVCVVQICAPPAAVAAPALFTFALVLPTTALTLSSETAFSVSGCIPAKNRRTSPGWSFCKTAGLYCPFDTPGLVVPRSLPLFTEFPL
jgi:hypothetical protein